MTTNLFKSSRNISLPYLGRHATLSPGKDWDYVQNSNKNGKTKRILVVVVKKL